MSRANRYKTVRRTIQPFSYYRKGKIVTIKKPFKRRYRIRRRKIIPKKPRRKMATKPEKIRSNESEWVTTTGRYKGHTETGTYVENLQTMNSCDSIVTTNLTIDTVYNIGYSIEIEQGETHTMPDGNVVDQVGIFKYESVTEAGCDSIITIEIITNISIIAELNTIKIFPNPNVGIFTILFDEISSGTIQISDITGKVIYTELINSNEQSKIVKLQNLKDGVYILTIKNYNLIKKAKIIINNIE